MCVNWRHATPAKRAHQARFREGRTKFYFETVAASGRRTGTLMEVMEAAKRINCDYLGVYASDVLKGTPGHPRCDREYERALQYGAATLGKS